MSIEIARYQFHSWARRGISSNIKESDDLGSGGSVAKERAEVPISVKLNGNALTKNFSLIGPGDIIGINRDMIIRTDPLNWITDTEPNYLALVEFYDEDFPWRYTPAVPQVSQKERLRPWIFLLVLKEDEFERTQRKIPLPAITIKNKDTFPPNDEIWLWAHVHSNADIPDAQLSDYEKFLKTLNTTINDDPDQIYSRLMSPRKLESNTAYFAFIVPVFETGRLAGLEQPTEGINAQSPSWDNNGAKGDMPVYYEWFFRTGTNADFESLVKLLEPRPMDRKLGIRSMDGSKPGFVTVDGNDFPPTQPVVLGLEGALRSPAMKSNPEDLPIEDFENHLQKIVNLPVTIEANPSTDPIISIPFYGMQHAKKSNTDIVMLDVNKDTWVNDLNRDPRTRVAAGFGTTVVQKNQESYMRKAWEQVTKILEANRQIKATKFMMSVALQYTQKTFSKFQSASLLAISGPVLKKIKVNPASIFHLLRSSRLPTAIFSSAFRRIIRPNGAVRRRLALRAMNKINYTRLVEDVNTGKITLSPPKGTPANLFTTQNIADVIFRYHSNRWLMCILDKSRIILAILLMCFLILAVVSNSTIIFGILGTAVVASYRLINRIRGNAKATEYLLDSQIELEAISTIRPQPDFTLKLSEEKTTPAPTVTAPRQDSVEAKNFRAAMIDLNKRLALKVSAVEPQEFDLDNAYANVSTAIHPHTSFPLRLRSRVKFPDYIDLSKPEKIFPAMAYPDIEDPMYKKLVDVSSELLLPNLKLVPPNTISLLETNQKFIESYMVGLNHEMGRELLWREYPTDQRGSYFRQFWDVKGIIRPAEGESETAELTEEFKDIKPIDTWRFNTKLGKHDNRNTKGYTEDDGRRLVLVIRGDLLKRYPNSVIFAQKAIEGVDATGQSPVIGLELDENGFKMHVKFPLFKAEIAPEIKFFGFDLTIEQARGTEKTPSFSDSLGWFFIIQEIPGEPRFGMDISFDKNSGGLSWDDLSWANLPSGKGFILENFPPNIHPADVVQWGTDAANMAYILFQKPSMVAVHAKEMLSKL